MKKKPPTESDLSKAADLLRQAVELEKRANELREEAARVMRVAPPLPLPRIRVAAQSAVTTPTE
jgi:hypothetical protein